MVIASTLGRALQCRPGWASCLGIAVVLFSLTVPAGNAADYFPPPDAAGGWRKLTQRREILRRTGIDTRKLDEALAYMKSSTPNGGLLVVRHGWLVYERYFGNARSDATPNLASCAKSITSIAIGILLAEKPELFPEGLDQRVFTPQYLPPEAFPLSDPRKAEIRLGHLLSMTAGIRGNNPAIVRGRPVRIDPEGPDGWIAMKDAMALGKETGDRNAITLWCPPGEGYSYSTASVHLLSVLLRQATGSELEQFIRARLGEPLGWSRWGYGYRQRNLPHTPGGGGIALRGTDLLRFLYLLLHEGQWHGKQLVPAAYVRACSRVSTYNPHTPYSLQFDVNADRRLAGVSEDAFWKAGSGGHGIYVVPSLDMIAVKLGGRDGQYSASDTGLPEPGGRVRSRPAWSSSVDAQGSVPETLRLIVAAVRQ